MFNWGTRKKEKFNVADTLMEQQENNSAIINELLRKNYELISSQDDVVNDIFEIVENQQKAIRNLQENLMRLQKLSEEAESKET